MNVEEWFRWKSDKDKTVEQVNKSNIDDLQWRRVDVLYSFLGVYSIGVYVKYYDKFECPSTVIRVKNQKQRLYSNEYLKEHYNEFPNVNDLEGIKKLLDNYFSIGNIIPIWPGGNVDKGYSGCYDLPELYFNKYQKWFNILIDMYDNSKLDILMDKEYSIETTKFLEWVVKDNNYENYLEHVNKVISERKIYLESCVNESRKANF